MRGKWEVGGGWDGQGDAAGCKLGRQVLSKTEAKSETASSMIWAIEFRAKGNNTAAAASQQNSLSSDSLSILHPGRGAMLLHTSSSCEGPNPTVHKGRMSI